MTRTTKMGGLTTLAATALLIVSGASGQGFSAPRADLTGTWTVSMSTQQGDVERTWELEHGDDGALTGSIGGRQGSAPAEDGWVKDDAFGFNVTRDFNGQSFEIEYEGTFADDALEGTLTAAGGQFTADFTGVRAGGQR